MGITEYFFLIKNVKKQGMKVNTSISSDISHKFLRITEFNQDMYVYFLQYFLLA